MKPLNVIVPTNSRHMLLVVGPYSNRGHCIYTIACNASGASYGVLIGGTSDMPFSINGSDNILTITSTSESANVLCVVIDIVLSGEHITLEQ